MATLINVYEPADTAGKPCIVFIHGLDGNVRTTWMANPKIDSTLWPTWLGEDTGCPVWLLEYEAATFRSSGVAMAVPTQATAILEALSAHPEIRQRPLILIGHSLGGILIKYALQQGMGQGVARHKETALNIKGIILVGTPHFGSKLAGLALRLPFLRPNPQVGNLSLDNPHLTDLNRYFLARHSELGFKVRLYYETEPVWPRGRLGRILFRGVTVVSAMSSDAHVPGEVAIPVQANHITISKPKDRDADMYRSVVAFIREVTAGGLSPQKSSRGHAASLPSQPSGALALYDVERTSNFIGQLQKWTVGRSARSLRLYVVEPAKYEPDSHATIFNSVISGFFAPKQVAVDTYSSTSLSAAPSAFDLLTFPEAFLPVDDLIVALNLLSAVGAIGCVHVGLRPTQQPNHLFTTESIATLLDTFRGLESIETDDLRLMDSWVRRQEPGKLFNLGCLFAIDQTGKTRICLHPKMVRSDFENTPTRENHMKEANVLSVVTLVPQDTQHISFTVQPLLCSDALFSATDVPGQRPFDGMTDPGDAFGAHTPPDSVDIVSLAACTPQAVQQPPKATKYRQWHERFRQTFTHLGLDAFYARHQQAMFVMSNFNEIAGLGPGGLSGAFLPQPPDYKGLPTYVETSSYGRHIQGVKDNEWSNPMRPAGKKDQIRSHLAVLRPDLTEANVLARLFGFTLSALPRQCNVYSGAAQLVDFDLREVKADETGEYVLGASKS
jgi:pimeloyl-ACP methyl ester carboxylesterase